MAVVKVFDSKGVKTLVLAGNANEQEYDPADESLFDAVEAQAEDEE